MFPICYVSLCKFIVKYAHAVHFVHIAMINVDGHVDVCALKFVHFLQRNFI